MNKEIVIPNSAYRRSQNEFEYFFGNRVGLFRHFLLATLVANLGNVSAEQVKALSEVLYADLETGTVRSMASLCTEAGVFDGKDDKYGSAMVYAGIKYERDEMEFGEEELNKMRKGGYTTSLADYKAGFGPQRPLFMELYSLYGNGIVNEDGRNNFRSTGRGASLAKTEDIIVQYATRKTKDEVLFVVGKRKTEVFEVVPEKSVDQSGLTERFRRLFV